MSAATKILQRYARAAHQLAVEADEVDRVGRELAALSTQFAEHDELRLQMSNPRLTRAGKRNIVTALLSSLAEGEGGAVSDISRRTVSLLVDRGRASIVGGLGGVYEAVAREASGRLRARVVSARPLTDEQRTRLVDELRQATGKTIELVEDVEASLLGGMRIFLGSRMIDGSVAGRLASVTDRLLRAPIAAEPHNEG